MSISLYTTLNSNNGSNVTTGGVWKMGFLAPSFPASLNVDGVTANYNTGDTIGTTHNPVINFTGAVTGIYQFDYTVTTTCVPAITGTSTLSIAVVAQVNNECSGAIIIPYPTVTNSSTLLANQHLYTCATNSVTPAAPTTTWYIPRSGDIWFKFTATSANVASITITGIGSCQLAIYSGTSCAGLTEIHAQIAGGGTLVTPNTVFTNGSTYWVRLAGGLVAGDTTFNITITT